MIDEEDELVTEVGANAEETEWVIRIFRPSGRRIAPNEFILEIESYLHDVSQSLEVKSDGETQLH